AMQMIAQDNSKVTFVPAKQLASAARRTGEIRPGLWYQTFDNNSRYSTGIVRRTIPTLAEMHTSWTDVWYVVSGGGTLVTGGSLIDSKKDSPGEFRGSGVSQGNERHIAPGDMITIPAGIPHWMRTIDGKEIVYVVVKFSSAAPAMQ
ncbi:MAG: cupin domain-containing protein, partial [Candidatus Acidiferrales bacterium]